MRVQCSIYSGAIASSFLFILSIMVDIHRDSNIYKAAIKNASGNTIAATVLGLSACVWLLLRSRRTKDTQTGVKEIPSPRGALPYLGTINSNEYQ